jgi:hypothetical protein
VAPTSLKPFAELCIATAANHIGTGSVRAQTAKRGQKVVLLRRRWHTQGLAIKCDRNPPTLYREERNNERSSARSSASAPPDFDHLELPRSRGLTEPIRKRRSLRLQPLRLSPGGRFAGTTTHDASAFRI